MSTDIRIRPMKPEDAGSVASLTDQLGYPSTRSQLLARILDVVRRDDGHLLVAEVAANAVVGWVHVRGQHLLESDPYAEIAGLVVDASVRRRGVGAKLMAAAEDWARRAGYPMIRVSTNTARVVSRPFYESQGYELLKTQYSLLKTLA